MEKDGAMLQKKDGARIIPFPPEFCMKRCMTIMMTKHGATASDDSMSRKMKEVAGAKNAALRKKRMTEVARSTNAAVRKNSMTVMCRTSHTTQAAQLTYFPSVLTRLSIHAGQSSGDWKSSAQMYCQYTKLKMYQSAGRLKPSRDSIVART